MGDLNYNKVLKIIIEYCIVSNIKKNIKNESVNKDRISVLFNNMITASEKKRNSVIDFIEYVNLYITRFKTATHAQLAINNIMGEKFIKSNNYENTKMKQLLLLLNEHKQCDKNERPLIINRFTNILHEIIPVIVHGVPNESESTDEEILIYDEPIIKDAPDQPDAKLGGDDFSYYGDMAVYGGANGVDDVGGSSDNDGSSDADDTGVSSDDVNGVDDTGVSSDDVNGVNDTDVSGVNDDDVNGVNDDVSSGVNDNDVSSDTDDVGVNGVDDNDVGSDVGVNGVSSDVNDNDVSSVDADVDGVNGVGSDVNDATTGGGLNSNINNYDFTITHMDAYIDLFDIIKKTMGDRLPNTYTEILNKLKANKKYNKEFKSKLKSKLKSKFGGSNNEPEDQLNPYEESISPDQSSVSESISDDGNNKLSSDQLNDQDQSSISEQINPEEEQINPEESNASESISDDGSNKSSSEESDSESDTEDHTGGGRFTSHSRWF